MGGKLHKSDCWLEQSCGVNKETYVKLWWVVAALTLGMPFWLKSGSLPNQNRHVGPGGRPSHPPLVFSSLATAAAEHLVAGEHLLPGLLVLLPNHQGGPICD